MKIADFELGSGKTFIVAELSANHNGDLDLACKTIESAAKAGADAVKIQTYRADTITLNSNSDDFKIKGGTLWDNMTYYELYEKAHTPWQWHEKLQQVAYENGLVFFSSPFDKTAVDYLENLNVPAYKIASFEINDIPLIEYAASFGKPVILSTGAAYKEEIEDAVAACRKVGNNNIILLKCTSSYPAPIDEANLKMIKRMAVDFNCLTGLSDHTLNNTVAIAAVALGACIVEKHFILDKSINSPDKAFSLDEKEFKKLVEDIRTVESAMGNEDYEISEASLKGRSFMRSLYAIKDIEKGEIFSYSNIGSYRPKLGLSPKYTYDVIGKKAKNNIKKYTPINEDLIERGE